MLETGSWKGSEFLSLTVSIGTSNATLKIKMHNHLNIVQQTVWNKPVDLSLVLNSCITTEKIYRDTRDEEPENLIML